MTRRGPWTIQESRDVYQDPWLRVQRDEVIRPDGLPGSYATVHIKCGVCVIAIDRENQVHLTREFHYAVGRLTVEGVSGAIEESETAQQAAQRELAEELGLVAQSWQHLGQVDPFTASVYSTVDLFVASGLSRCERALEGTEVIEPVDYSLERTIEMVRNGEITHCPTCIALLRVALDGTQPSR